MLGDLSRKVITKEKRIKKGVDFLTTDGHVSLPPAVTATVDGWVPDRKTRKKNKYLKTHVKQAVEFNNRSRTQHNKRRRGNSADSEIE